MLARDDIKALVLSALEDMVGSGRSVEISETTDPKRDLDLDSEDGVGFACEISSRMKRLFPEDLNPFVDDHKRKIRSVGEIIDFIAELQPEMEELDNEP